MSAGVPLLSVWSLMVFAQIACPGSVKRTAPELIAWAVKLGSGEPQLWVEDSFPLRPASAEGLWHPPAALRLPLPRPLAVSKARR